MGCQLPIFGDTYVSSPSQADKKFVNDLEKRLSPGTMVFQLPVQPFPGNPPIFGMSDYESFRPYIFSHYLHFSYGCVKGRPREAWQQIVAAQPACQMIGSLQKIGFGTIILNRKGYADHGNEEIGSLSTAGAELVDSSNPDLVAFIIRPTNHPIPPPSTLIYGDGFYPAETTNNGATKCWSKKARKLLSYNSAPYQQLGSLKWILESKVARRVDLTFGQKSWSYTLLPAQPVVVDLLQIFFHPGINRFKFTSDTVATISETEPRREVAFSVQSPIPNID